MASKSDHQIIRDYVTAIDHLQYSQLPDGIVAVLVTHSNLRADHLDIRLDLHDTIEAVKEKFRKHFGTPIQFQKLILKERGETVTEMWDNTKMLGYYSVISGMEIHVIDTDPFSLSKNGGLTDVSLIQKYKMSDEKYAERKGTMKEYIREKKLKDPNFVLKPLSDVSKPLSNLKSGVNLAENSEVVVPGLESVIGMNVGDRCEVRPGRRRGVVKYVGEVSGLSDGYWVGVCFDEPVGRSDGYVKGVKIFDCSPKYGGFIRGANVKTGDFPVRDLMDDEDDDNKEDEANHEDEDEI